MQSFANPGKRGDRYTLLGLDEARRRANRLVMAACDALSHYGARAEPLREAARFVVERKR